MSVLDALKERYNVRAYTGHRDNERCKRYFLHFDMPTNLVCRIMGHDPYQHHLGFTECRQCFRRPPGYERNTSSHLEVSSRFVGHFSIQLSVGNSGSETPIDGHIIIPKFRGIYFGTDVIGHVLVNLKTRRREARGTGDHYNTEVYGLSIDKQSIRWQFGAEKNSWTSGTPKWKDGHWDFKDTFFGKTQYTRETLATAESTFFMPERDYEAVFTLQHETWTRKRWTEPKTEISVSIDVKGGVPNGREKYGEEDATFGFGVAAADTGPGWLSLAKARATVRMMDDRERNTGDRNWIPSMHA